MQEFFWSLLASILFSCGLAAAGGLFTGPPTVIPVITSVTYGVDWRYNSTYPPKTVNGDGWNSTWDDNGTIVIGHDDGSAWNGTGLTYNTAYNTLTDTTMTSSTVGSLLNGMAAWQGTGSDGGTYKNGGIVSIAGVYYSMSWRLAEASLNLDSQLLKSTDHGTTFTPTPPSTGAPYTSPMFPGKTVPMGVVQYGQNYTGTGPDNSANYVYWLVRASAVADGQTVLYLSRVKVTDIANMNAADWTYWTNSLSDGDGTNSANWSGSVGSAVAVINASDGNGGKAGPANNGMQYLPRYHKYLYIADQQITLTNRNWFTWICDHPWGPCSQLGSAQNWNPAGYYFPQAMPSSVTGGGTSLVVSTAGDYNDLGSPTGRYTLTLVPVTIAP